MVTLLAGQLLVVTRMDTLKSGWTPYVYYTTLYSIPHYTYYIYSNLLGTFFKKSGEIKVKDSCARVEYRDSTKEK